MAKKIEVKVPDIGDYHDVPVIEVLVRDGDAVEKDAPLLVLESDKATLEVPSPAAGTVRDFKLKASDKVSQGTLICSLEVAGDAGQETRDAKRETPAKQPAEQPAPAAASPAPAAKKDEPSRAASPAALLPVAIPDIGDYRDVPVIEVLVKDGDAVEKDAPLLVLESDKATLEVPSPAAGTVRDFKLKAGDKVSQGDPVCRLATAAVAVAVAADERSETRDAPKPPEHTTRSAVVTTDGAPPKPPAPVAAKGDTPYAGPAARKFARQLGVDLAQVSGSGTRGRIQIEDVQAYVKQALGAGLGPQPQAFGAQRLPLAVSETRALLPAIPVVDFAQFGEIETRPLARIRKLSAAHLHRAWLNVPHVTQTDEADITQVEAFRKSSTEETGVKLTLLPFIMKAVAKAMQAYPEFNSSLSADGESLILKKYCHIGFAAETEQGLVVPVVRDVDKKGVTQLAQECGALARKARDGKLKAEEMKGGCFSISSLGGIGGSHFTPIVNAPEVAILGASRAQMKPVWDGKQFQPRLMLPLSLSYDHRVIDGAYAARFIVQLVKLLTDVRRLAL
ncbi:MAG TPA: dihydrolipoyllysine-residue acetyltransferase [Stenotrophobium sp.]|jgi:pyruvate dehydrogenase E2 component (dihydrolipoamide acetyltransferase)|nr:dihydrolipoyllysine-residue acetyltransferase [Stenotrophobium sp.]